MTPETMSGSCVFLPTNTLLGRHTVSLPLMVWADHGNIVVEFYINNNKALFARLFEQKDEIEQQLGFPVVWDRLDNKKASRIKYTIDGLNFDDHSNYDTLMNASIDAAVKMRDVFKQYI